MNADPDPQPLYGNVGHAYYRCRLSSQLFLFTKLDNNCRCPAAVAATHVRIIQIQQVYNILQTNGKALYINDKGQADKGSDTVTLLELTLSAAG